MKLISVKVRGGTLAAAALGSIAIAQPAAAQGAASAEPVLEEVVITAEKRANTVQDTPISVVAVSGEALQREGRNDIRDVLSTVAGVTFSNSAFGATNINLRGVEGVTAPLAGKTDPGVAVNFDGVYSATLLGDAGAAVFYDVARVEVLRGPQGTLYGRNAAGGVLNIITNEPGDELDAAGALELGNYSLRRITGAVNVPLGDHWAVRAAMNKVERDGYYTSGANADDTLSGRVKLRYDADGVLRMLLGAEYTDTGGGLGTGGQGAGIRAWGLGDPPTDPWSDLTTNGGVTGQAPGSIRDNERFKAWAEFDFRTPVGTLKLLPNYTRVQNSLVLVTHPATAAPGVYTPLPGSTNGKQNSAEVRFNSPDSSNVKWVIGAFKAAEDAYIFSTQFTRQTWQDNESTAGFGQLTWPFADSWSLTAGLRSTKDEKHFVSQRTTGALRRQEATNSWSRTDWKVGLQKDLNPDQMIYATVATGYRPGGVDTTTTATITTLAGTVVPNPNVFSKPEYLTTLELGSKNELLDGRLRLNANLYYYDYKDRQFTYFITTADPRAACPNGSAPQVFPPDVVCNVMLNLNDVRSIGAEIETLWAPTDADRVSVSFAYQDSKVDGPQQIGLSIPPGSTIPAGSPVTGNLVTLNVEGETTPRSPKIQANVWYEHSFKVGGGQLALRADARYMSESYISGFNQLNPVINSRGFREGDAYIIEANTRLDAMLRYDSADGRWSIGLYGKNLTDEIVKSDTDGSYTQVEAPRTYGAVFNIRM